MSDVSLLAMQFNFQQQAFPHHTGDCGFLKSVLKGAMDFCIAKQISIARLLWQTALPYVAGLVPEVFPAKLQGGAHTNI